MTVEEKAKQLIGKFLPLVRNSDLYDTYERKARQCAIICVEEILSSYPTTVETFYNSKGLNVAHIDNREYWKEVLEHLNNKQ